MATRPTNRLNAAHQALALRAAFPSARVSVRRRRLSWVGNLRPTPLSAEYTIRIYFSPERFPRIFVLNPALVTRPDESIPHMYRDGSLCLHKEGDWSAEMFIVDTIVPWTCEWLAHYEVWLAVGEWYGGGEWPPSDPTSLDRSNADSQFQNQAL